MQFWKKSEGQRCRMHTCQHACTHTSFRTHSYPNTSPKQAVFRLHSSCTSKACLLVHKDDRNQPTTGHTFATKCIFSHLAFPLYPLFLLLCQPFFLFTDIHSHARVHVCRGKQVNKTYSLKPSCLHNDTASESLPETQGQTNRDQLRLTRSRILFSIAQPDRVILKLSTFVSPSKKSTKDKQTPSHTRQTPALKCYSHW